MKKDQYFVEVSTTYKVYEADSLNHARTLVELFEEGDDYAKTVVTVKDQRVDVERDSIISIRKVID